MSNTPPTESKSDGLSKWALGGLAAAALVGVGVVFYKMMASSSAEEKKVASKVAAPGKKKKKKKKSVAEKLNAMNAEATTAPTTTKEKNLDLNLETAMSLTKDMIDEMSHIISRLSYQIQDYASKGVSEEKINEIFQKRYIEEISAAHIRCLDNYNTTEAAADAAAAKYANNPEFAALLKKIEKMTNTLAGQGPSEEELATVPAWLDMKMVLTIFREIMATVTESIITSIRDQYNEEEPPSRTATPAELNRAQALVEAKIHERYKKAIEVKKSQIFTRYEIDESMLDLALSKYATDPSLGQEIQRMQMHQKVTVEAARKEIRTEAGWPAIISS
jgi:uncharacterized membrane-anchored protein